MHFGPIPVPPSANGARDERRLWFSQPLQPHKLRSEQLAMRVEPEAVILDGACLVHVCDLAAGITQLRQNFVGMLAQQRRGRHFRFGV